MTDEKRKRIIAAATVATILLIAILAFTVIYQLVFINAQKRKKIELKNKIEQLEQLTGDKRDTLDYFESDAGLEDLAYEFGFVYGR